MGADGRASSQRWKRRKYNADLHQFGRVVFDLNVKRRVVVHITIILLHNPTTHCSVSSTNNTLKFPVTRSDATRTISEEHVGVCPVFEDFLAPSHVRHTMPWGASRSFNKADCRTKCRKLTENSKPLLLIGSQIDSGGGDKEQTRAVSAFNCEL